MRRELKCWPEPFQAIVDELKRFEIRVEPARRFEVNEVIVLREWEPGPRPILRWHRRGGKYTGRRLRVRVGYIVRGPEWGVPEGLVVMSVVNLRPGER